MATSGQGASWTVVDTFCTLTVTYWHRFDQLCNWAGLVDVETDSNGTARFTCPYCAGLNETTCERLGLE